MFLLPEGTVELLKTKGKGHGIRVKKTIAPGTIVGDYIGVITRSEDVPDEGDDFYDMVWNDEISIVADPDEMGVHLINHSCAPNCGMFPYKGHILFCALRKIFAGEELTISYMLNPPEPDEAVLLDTCRCDTPVCRGTLYTSSEVNDRFYAFEEKMCGDYLNKNPGAFGTKLVQLAEYPKSVPDYDVYDMFGYFSLPPVQNDALVLPSVSALRGMIRESGCCVSYPALNILVLGIMNGLIVAKSIKE